MIGLKSQIGKLISAFGQKSDFLVFQKFSNSFSKSENLFFDLFYRNPLQIATASESRKFKLMHAVEPKFVGFKTCRLRLHQIQIF
jgi:hypothetical protein